ncbi:hypothetical protein M427DRAFT_130207 [Gonapodya prolifera JEL478]|uniref:Uncharacterized protein n=1 Tax=Gonapodya prolifera (strain JEL478) TaxID=1344416 RepID=A0A139B0M8_GONPJ|nr:hypothetical protein M427DRAFT_130207 [Gonapodya prolifera JEL478]|eukprot:KXS22551.1 hypothetical protein M427DRAFT_130207 [Gonapodya prolifera JEL478]
MAIRFFHTSQPSDPTVRCTIRTPLRSTYASSSPAFTCSPSTVPIAIRPTPSPLPFQTDRSTPTTTSSWWMGTRRRMERVWMEGWVCGTLLRS